MLYRSKEARELYKAAGFLYLIVIDQEITLDRFKTLVQVVE